MTTFIAFHLSALRHTSFIIYEKRPTVASLTSVNDLFLSDIGASLSGTLVKNKYTKMYLEYIYFMLSVLEIHLHIYVLNKNTLKLYFNCTKKSKLEELILYLMRFNCVEVVLKSN